MGRGGGECGEWGLCGPGALTKFFCGGVHRWPCLQLGRAVDCRVAGCTSVQVAWTGGGRHAWRKNADPPLPSLRRCCHNCCCRDVEPTALLLRSGDVVVMGQQARACYHGVPRVLTDRPLPPELAAHAGLQDQACLQHMQGCRINISIRSTV